MHHGAVAQILLTPDTLTVSLTDLEQVEALHRDLTVPRSAVTDVRAVSDGMAELHGIRAPGTGLPGVIAVGTWRDRGTTTFAVCHGRHPAVVVTLRGQSYDRLVITVEQPSDVVASLRS